jgi:hypothetical protein
MLDPAKASREMTGTYTSAVDAAPVRATSHANAVSGESVSRVPQSLVNACRSGLSTNAETQNPVNNGQSELAATAPSKLNLNSNGVATSGAPAGNPSTSAGEGPNSEVSAGKVHASDALRSQGLANTAQLSSDPTPANPLPQATATDVSSASNAPNSAKPSLAGESRQLKPASATQEVRSTAHSAPAVETSSSVPISHISAEAHSNTNSVASTTSISAASAQHDPFSALDERPGSGSITWTHAGKQQAEAGFHDPSLGWVAVRADLHSGGVHAAVLASSSDSAAVLGSELAGLDAHLHEQQIAVSSFTVADAASQSMNQSMQQDMNHGAGHNNSGDARQNRPALDNQASSGASTSTSSLTVHHAAVFSQPAAVGGTHISVMA